MPNAMSEQMTGANIYKAREGKLNETVVNRVYTNKMLLRYSSILLIMYRLLNPNSIIR